MCKKQQVPLGILTIICFAACYGKLSLREHVVLVLLNLGDVVLAYRHVVLQVEVVVDSAERQCLSLLEQSQTFKILTFVLVLAQSGEWFEQSLEQRLLSSAHADDVGSDTVDRSVEIVKADMCAAKGVGTDELGKQVASVIIEEGAIVLIPFHRTTVVEHQFVHEEEQARHHVAYILGGLVVASVQGVDNIVLGAVAGVEIM